MNQERWKFVEQIYYQALDLDQGGRDAFIREVCAADEDARREVEALIEAHERAGDFIIRPAFEAAAEAIAEKLNKVAPGQTLGHYKILDTLGAGGMGEVYLAQDSRLGRKVAIKMLPDALSPDALSMNSERLRRFRQEARAASATNHPNILTIHEVGEIDGANYIVTEFVDGETLRKRMQGERLPLDAALDIAIQVGSALEAAHEAGIAHRDIKPENIMLRRDGIVKVLDFGIAKLVERERRPEGTEKDSASYFETETGMVIGTAPYMSPEQARGEKEIDARTDIFSLGVVLYEMIVGQSPFASNTFAETVASILHLDPPSLRARRDDVPPELEKIVAQALSKRREDRYQTARELRADLVSLKRRLEINPQFEQSPPNTGVAETRVDSIAAEDSLDRPNRRAARIVAAAAMTAIAAAVIAYLIYKPLPAAPPAFRAEAKKLTESGKVICAAISPDGNYIAYAEQKSGKQGLWFRHVNGAEPLEIVGPDDVTYVGLTFSPDGEFVYYTRRQADGDAGALYRVRTTDRSSEKLIERIDTPVTFSPGGDRIAFGRGDSSQGRSNLIIANVDGDGEETLASHAFSDYFCLGGIAWSPDGKRIACSSVYKVSGADLVSVVSVRVSNGEETKISSAEWRDVKGMSWAGDGGLLVVATGKEDLRSQIFHLAYASGEANKITNDANDYNGISLSSDLKRLVTAEYRRHADIWVATADGNPQQLGQITSGEDYFDLSWTPDGRIIASRVDNDGLNLWLMDADGANPRQLTFGGGQSFRGAVTPDGRHIVYVSNQKGAYNLWRMDADGSNKKRLTNGPGEFAPRLTPDGKTIFHWSDVSGRRSVFRVSIEGGASQPLTDKMSQNPAVSPNGKFAACYFGENETDMQRQVAILLTSGGAPVKIFNIPFGILQWSRDSTALTYIDVSDGKDVWSQPLDGGAPKRLIGFNSRKISFFDWAPDGKRIALVCGAGRGDIILLRD